MASWIQRFLLTGCCLVPLMVSAQDDDPLEPIVGTDIERRAISEDMLDSENFEIGVYGGVLGIEDFGSNAVTGANIAYHITEDFFVEAIYGISEANKTSYELLSGAVELLNDEEREFTYYALSIGYKLFPGQVFIGSNTAFNTHFYITAGGGNTEFAGNRYATYTFGAGYKFYMTDWFALDIGMRDHMFSHELFGETRNTNNFEGRMGLSVYF
ncbi:outer membrane beta-barrel domain-containing protein [Gilvimarinus sp. SDUM040013]|uniref:Outer membrane beta-barrel domain-containing protein n=1 Tax=Gilvimarinus gilvus TaxID=3058038 RepID=A0ABU4S1A8_9GAMM|nr:outer membrane beta-barrel domain-containing protein [Gilvimarinus sp. SDUM040013]MDO3384680.1 outer membrane beta-barrel domain-containing protein [Gilvimarinus sp. SDUM040013]MDX6850266.1 outer membrane beta-barrel domain-containing protein [Gilvimarinus sp. SDUM040013]